MLISFSAFGQEICDNAIDDDGDGLIDLMDGECNCGSGTMMSEFFDFEQMSCCPDDFTGGFGQGIECLDNGWEVIAPTPDFLHMCDYFGLEGTGVPAVPLPSGDGCIGFGNHFGFTEVLGICLDAPILSGTMVTVDFEFGFGDGTSNQSISPFEMAVFCTTDCSNVSPAGAWDCLENHGWTEMGTANMVGPMSSWTSGSITFTADQDYEMFSIGASCNQLSSYSLYTYHFLDDVEIVYEPGSDIDVSDIEQSGDCSSGYQLEISEPDGISFQWYLDGIAILGETSDVLSLMTPYDIGAYQVLVSFSDGCGISSPYDFFPELNTLVILGSIEDILCFDDDSGLVTLDVSSFDMPVDISWDTGSNSPSLSNLEAGEYEVTVTDANGCFGIETFEVGEPDELSVTVSITGQPFDMNPLGSASANATGGTPGYDYLWDNGETTATAVNLLPGVHSVTITDENGCEVIETVVINDILSLDLNVIGTTCFGECTGSIMLEVDGGESPYFFEWSNGESISDITDVCAGIYEVTVTDDFGTILINSGEVFENEEIVLSATIVGLSCIDSDDNAIDLEVSGGSFPYLYDWSNGSVSQDISNVLPDTYIVTVIDDNNCMATATYEIEEYPEITFDETVSNAECGSENNGSIILTMLSGDGPFTFLWNNGDTTQDLGNISGGLYDLIITDVHGCMIESSFAVNEESDLDVNYNVISPTCPNVNNGSIELLVSGGTEPYVINWTSLGLDNIIVNNLLPGFYPVIITDQNDCSWIENIELIDPDSIEVTAEVTNPGCINVSDGTVELSLSGGNPPYSILWDNGQTDLLQDSLASGIYSVTITDDATCQYIYEYEIIEPIDLEFSVDVHHINCVGDSLGQIEIIGLTDGGIVWNTGDTLPLLDSLIAATYSYTIVDVVGCTYIDSIELIDYRQNDTTYLFEQDCDILNIGLDTSILLNVHFCDSLIITETSIQEADTTFSFLLTCDELEIGFDTILIPSTEFCDSVIIMETILAPNDTTIVTTITCLFEEVGLDSLHLSNSNGCDSLVIINTNLASLQPLSISMILKNDYNGYDIDCFGNSTGALDIVISGGASPYLYQWENGSDAKSRTDLFAGWYYVTITDANNCLISDSILLNEPEVLGIDITKNDIDCESAELGSVMISSAGGVTPYEWQIDENGFSIDNVFSDLEEGTYLISCRDANGCYVEEMIDILPTGNISVTLGENIFIDLGESIQLIPEITYNGGDLNIQWTGGDLSCINCSEPWISPVVTQEYAITVTDENGCMDSDSITIFVKQDDSEIYFPNVFNPNSTSGNDLFFFSSSEAFDINELILFDRWGNSVYVLQNQLSGMDFGWDGRFNGIYVNAGVYVFKVDITLSDGSSRIFYGSITIVY